MKHVVAVFSLFTFSLLHSQEMPSSNDPCGLPDTTTAEYRMLASGNWGYGYDTLLIDIARWKKNLFVTVDSIGASVQHRTLFMLTIEDTSSISTPRKRVWIHARTHPNEVQGTWVTNELIRILLEDSVTGKRLRDSCIFNIVPMYNPDGVELGLARQNANNIDIESNWNTFPHQPEVLSLKNTFVQLMQQSNPIQVALNMHSAFACKRYFVFHDSTGTSENFAKIQRGFIEGIRPYFPNNIEPWNYLVSWKGSAALQYPESWFWGNHRESVLALTYEDMNCASNGKYDSTANAIALGLIDFLGIADAPSSIVRTKVVPDDFALYPNYPNPFNSVTTITFSIPDRGINEHVQLKVHDILGRECALLVDQPMSGGTYQVHFNAQDLSSGLYIYSLKAGGRIRNGTMVLLK